MKYILFLLLVSSCSFKELPSRYRRSSPSNNQRYYLKDKITISSIPRISPLLNDTKRPNSNNIRIINDKNSNIMLPSNHVDFSKQIIYNEDDFIEQPSHYKPLFFKTNKATLEKDHYTALKEVLRFLILNPSYCVRIEGHCDIRGTERYNLSLSERRALSVREYFIAERIKQNRIFTIGYGEEKLLDDSINERAHASNRRVQFVILKRKQ